MRILVELCVLRQANWWTKLNAITLFIYVNLFIHHGTHKRMFTWEREGVEVGDTLCCLPRRTTYKTLLQSTMMPP
jgi:hypothetical protein